jgi:hypothetical protein
LGLVPEIGLDYLLEGDSVLPGQVHKLSIDFPGRVTSCFAGYPSVDPKAKLEEVRHNSGHLNDWLNDRSDEYILAFIKSMVEFSAELQDECERYAIPFFDVSQGFPENLNAMVQYLTGSHSENTRQHIATREHTGNHSSGRTTQEVLNPFRRKIGTCDANQFLFAF